MLQLARPAGSCSAGSFRPGAEDGWVPHPSFSMVAPAGANTGHTAGFYGGQRKMNMRRLCRYSLTILGFKKKLYRDLKFLGILEFFE